MATMDARTQNVRTQSPRVLLWLIAIGFFMETLDSTIVNTALPSMAQSLGESPLMMQSVIISYTLTLAVFIPASGFLADRFGTEKTYFAAILLFTLGSLACALSTTLTEIVLARVLQGLGGCMLLPVGRLAILRAFPGDKFLDALSFVTMPALIGPVLGPTLGGWLVEYASWHWIFLINIPIGVVGCVATWFSMPESESQPDRRFDLPGFIQVSLFMVAVLFAFDGLSELNLSHGTVLLLFFLGLASLVSYILRASRVENPLFALNLFKVRTFTVGILGNLFARVGSSGMPFLIPLFLQLSLGASPFQAGLTMLPLALSAIVAKRFVSPIVRKIGYRNFLIYNTLAVGFGMASFALMTDQQSTWLRIIQLLLFGTVNSMQFTAMNTLTLKDLDRAKASGGNALFSMVQMLSLSFAVAVAGALLSAFMERFDVHLHPEMALRAFHAAFICMGGITCTSAWIFWQIPENVRAKVDQSVSLEE
jgi:EmrB/QacA subfamily drug resistance transporter